MQVGLILGEQALTGTVTWGRRKGNTLRPKEEWLSLSIPRILDDETWSLAQKLRGEREPHRSPGRAPSKPKLLKGLAWCGKCGASYQYETSGKKVVEEKYTYGYYNCRSLLRVGKEACAGFRIPLDALDDALDDAVMHALERVVCTDDRARAMTGHHAPDFLARRRAILHRDDVARIYAVNLIDRIDVHDEQIVITMKSAVGESRPPSAGSLPAPET